MATNPYFKQFIGQKQKPQSRYAQTHAAQTGLADGVF